MHLFKELWRVLSGFGIMEFLSKKFLNFQKRINTLIDQKALEENKIRLFNDFLNSL